MHHRLTRAMAVVAASAMTLLPVYPASARDKDDSSTKTPIKHVVVIFQENVSFDHYFGTYPHAANLAGETPFHAKDDTPSVNGLESSGLLTHNPNSTQPFRLSPAQAVTCDQDHDYGHEQKAFHAGLMDLFPETVGVGGPGCFDAGKGKGLVMGYYDGNTVTALWNYAQHFAMSDNSFSTTFGPSTPGAVNLISGNTYGATLVPFAADGKTPGNPKDEISGGLNFGSVIGDPRPGYDNCLRTPVLGTAKSTRITMSGKNVGDLLTDKNITWGWFQGGFAPTGKNADGSLACASVSSTSLVRTFRDYIPHHEPFQYYRSTSNPDHQRPSAVTAIGKTDQANHQYDLQDFFTALANDNLPAVSFLKAKGVFDGHAGYSDPIDEQAFLVNTINTIMNSKEWRETAIIIAYDDSDGWYDHQMGPIVTQSDVSDDELLGAGNCGTPKATQPGGKGQNGRCGYGPRQPLLVISPWAKRNYVDHAVTDQSSILRFIEDNWSLGRIGNGSTDAIAGTLNGLFDFDGRSEGQRLILDPRTGTVVDPD
jgi:phospholipase C